MISIYPNLLSSLNIYFRNVQTFIDVPFMYKRFDNPLHIVLSTKFHTVFRFHITCKIMHCRLLLGISIVKTITVFILFVKKCYVRLTNKDYGTSLKSMLQVCMPILPGIIFILFFVCLFCFVFVFFFLFRGKEGVKPGIVHYQHNKFTFALLYTCKMYLSV